MFHLVVVSPFWGYQKGDIITDQKRVEMLLKGDNAHHVVKIKAPQSKPQPAVPTGPKPHVAAPVKPVVKD